MKNSMSSSSNMQKKPPFLTLRNCHLIQDVWVVIVQSIAFALELSCLWVLPALKVPLTTLLTSASVDASVSGYHISACSLQLPHLSYVKLQTGTLK